MHVAISYSLENPTTTHAVIEEQQNRNDLSCNKGMIDIGVLK